MARSMREALLRMHGYAPDDEEEEKKKKKKKQKKSEESEPTVREALLSMHGYETPATSREVETEKGFWETLGGGLARILRPVGSGILNVLDVIDRPRNAIMNMMAESARMNKQNSEVIEKLIREARERGDKKTAAELEGLYLLYPEELEYYLKKKGIATAGVVPSSSYQTRLRSAFKRGLRPESNEDRAGFIDVLEINNEWAKDMHPALRFGVGLAGDMLFDPLSYLGVGALTDKGKAAQTITSAKKAKSGIAPGSRVARLIAQYGDDALAPTLSQQARQGQRALITLAGEPLIPGVKAFEGLENIGSAVSSSRLGQTARRLFSTKTGNQMVDEAVELSRRFDTRRRKRIGEALAKYDELRRLVDDAAELSGLGVDEITDLIERPFKFDQYGQPIAYRIDDLKLGTKQKRTLKELAEKIWRINDEILEAERAAGLPVDRFGSNQLRYFPRFKTQEAIKKAGGVTGYEVPRTRWTVNYKSLKDRKFKDKAIKDINELFRTQKGIGKYFIDDPAVAETLRRVESAKAITNAEFLQEMIKRYGAKSADDVQRLVQLYNVDPDSLVTIGSEVIHATKGNVADTVKELVEAIKGGNKKQALSLLDNITPKRYDPYLGILKDVQFTPEVAEFITQYIEKQAPKELNGLAKALRSATNWWKAQTLHAIPSYHARNLVGNFWQNYLAGVINPQDYKQALDIMRKKKGAIVTGTGSRLSFDDIRRLAEETGVLDVGFYKLDFDTLEKGAKQLGKPSLWRRLNPFSSEFFLIKKGANVGSAIEGNARLAHFINKLKQGLDPTDAARSVNEFLFDYSNLTDFEKGVRDYVMPFYTFARKNLPLQLRNIAQQPGKYSGVQQVIQNYSKLRGGMADDTYMPDWLKSSAPMQVSGDEEGGHFFPVANWLPIDDVNQLGTDPMGTLTEKLSPFIKMPIELTLNRSFFNQSPIYQERATPEEQYGDILKYITMNLYRPAAEIIRATDPEKTEVERMIRPIVGSVYYYDVEEAIERRIRELRTMAAVYRNRGDTAKANELEEEAERLAVKIGQDTGRSPRKAKTLREALLMMNEGW